MQMLRMARPRRQKFFPGSFGRLPLPNAVEGIAAGCAATAIAACSAAIAGTSYTGPGAIGACSGALLSTFKVCILGIKAEAVVGAIVKELNINITTTDNWAPL
jgi:hypothetical protein